MSETRAVIRDEIRQMLSDNSSDNPAWTDERINRAITRHMRIIGNEVLMGKAWVTSAVTTVVGTADYTLPTGVEYAQILSLKLLPFNSYLRPQTIEWIELARQGATLGQGIPNAYALWEDTSQVVNLRLWPIPNAIYTIDLERSIIPGALTSDSATVPFSENLIIGLEYRVAAEMAGIGTDEQLQVAGLGPNAGAAFSSMAEQVIRRERERISRVYSVPGIGKASI